MQISHKMSVEIRKNEKTIARELINVLFCLFFYLFQTHGSYHKGKGTPQHKVVSSNALQSRC